MLYLYLYIFFYLLLAHSLADFVFQPKALIAWKHKSWKGIFVHSLILFVTILAFFWPIFLKPAFGPGFEPFAAGWNFLGMAILLLIAVLHFFIDTDKIHRERKERHYVRLFFMDQFYHAAVFGVVTPVLVYCLKYDGMATRQLLNFFSGFLPFAIYLMLAVLSTYFYEIVRFQFLRQKKAGTIMKFRYDQMFLRLMILSLIFGIILFFSGFHIARTFLK